MYMFKSEITSYVFNYMYMPNSSHLNAVVTNIFQNVLVIKSLESCLAIMHININSFTVHVII